MSSRREPGFTLVEMVIAIVIIGIGLAGVLLAINTTVRSSADPLIRKQMLAIAEELLEEALLKPFAVAGAAPNNLPQICDVNPIPSRIAFDDISDYHNYRTTGICAITGATIVGLTAYELAIQVSNTSLGDITLDSGNAKQINVTVTHGADHLTLTGFRTNYAQ